MVQGQGPPQAAPHPGRRPRRLRHLLLLARHLARRRADQSGPRELHGRTRRGMVPRARRGIRRRLGGEPLVLAPPAEGRRRPRPRHHSQADCGGSTAQSPPPCPTSRPCGDRAPWQARPLRVRASGRPPVAWSRACRRSTRPMLRPEHDPHQLRRGRGLDGPEAPQGHAVLGQPDTRRRPLQPHRPDLGERRHVARRRLQCRVPDVRLQRRLLHGQQDGRSVADRGRLVRGLQERLVTVGQWGRDVAMGPDVVVRAPEPGSPGRQRSRWCRPPTAPIRRCGARPSAAVSSCGGRGSG